jgi:adenosylcobinamide-phosphate synthase
MSLLLALVIDGLWGEPPLALHPVAWMGSYLKRVGASLPDLRAALAFTLGTTFWLIGAGITAALYTGAAVLCARLPFWLAVVLTALLLKPLLALRMLVGEVRGVEEALRDGLEAGRTRLSRIVSRDTNSLDPSQIRESALESLAENLSDSVVAPLFWFALLGLPGAAVYRFANTADAMWGYRGQWEWAGKFAARVDDVLNLVPARLTAVALLLTCPGVPRGWRALRLEASRTQSPNSGWPMGALALTLGVRLRKPGVYTLNERGREPSSQDVVIAIRHSRWAAWGLAVGLACLAALHPVISIG